MGRDKAGDKIKQLLNRRSAVYRKFIKLSKRPSNGTFSYLALLQSSPPALTHAVECCGCRRREQVGDDRIPLAAQEGSGQWQAQVPGLGRPVRPLSALDLVCQG